jgi:hypothetical protein
MVIDAGLVAPQCSMAGGHWATGSSYWALIADPEDCGAGSYHIDARQVVLLNGLYGIVHDFSFAPGFGFSDSELRPNPLLCSTVFYTCSTPF